jgi:uncharacterized membrane protein
MMIFFFLLLVAAIAYVSGWRPQLGQWTQPISPADRGASNNALKILRERYAHGEISREQYLDMRDELSR